MTQLGDIGCHHDIIPGGPGRQVFVEVAVGAQALAKWPTNIQTNKKKKSDFIVREREDLELQSEPVNVDPCQRCHGQVGDFWGGKRRRAFLSTYSSLCPLFRPKLWRSQ